MNELAKHIIKQCSRLYIQQQKQTNSNYRIQQSIQSSERKTLNLYK